MPAANSNTSAPRTLVELSLPAGPPSQRMSTNTTPLPRASISSGSPRHCAKAPYQSSRKPRIPVRPSNTPTPVLEASHTASSACKVITASKSRRSAARSVARASATWSGAVDCSDIGLLSIPQRRARTAARCVKIASRGYGIGWVSVGTYSRGGPLGRWGRSRQLSGALERPPFHRADRKAQLTDAVGRFGRQALESGFRARSSVDRALASGARGRKFESCRARGGNACGGAGFGLRCRRDSRRAVGR